MISLTSPFISPTSSRTLNSASWADWVHGTALATTPRENLKIVACHHPLGGGGIRHRTRGGVTALTALAAAGAGAVLSGHTHEPFDHLVDGVRLIGAGTLSERVRQSPPSFNVLTVDAGVLAVAARMME